MDSKALLSAVSEVSCPWERSVKRIMPPFLKPVEAGLNGHESSLSAAGWTGDHPPTIVCVVYAMS